MEWVVLNFTVLPLDHLWIRLQFLDERKRTLTAVAGSGRDSPFAVCRRALCDFLTTPVQDGNLACASWFYEDSHDEMMHLARLQILEMDAQVWWRFYCFTEFPCKLAKVVDPLTENPLAVLQDLFSTPMCCLTESFCRKVRRVFASAELCFADARFHYLLRNWTQEFKAVNMHTERLIALIRRGVGPDVRRAKPDVERVVAAGTLAQWQAEHTRCGNAKPGITTRGQLKAQGTPLACTCVGNKNESKPAGGFLIFRAKRVRERLAQHGSFSATQQAAELQELREEWAALAPLAQQTYTDQAKVEHSRSELAHLANEPTPAADKVDPILWGLNSTTSPLSDEAFEQVTREKFNLGDDEALPGSRRLCQRLREELRDDVFVKDAGALGFCG